MSDQDTKSSVAVALFSEKSSLLSMIRKELRSHQFRDEDILDTTADNQVYSHLGDNVGIVVIDWDLGVEKTIPLLERVSEHRNVWSAFLIAGSPSDKLMALAKEFGISQVHTGNLSQSRMKLAIDKLVKETRSAAPLRKLMGQIGTLQLKTP